MRARIWAAAGSTGSPPGQPGVIAGRVRPEQVLVNLLQNALDAVTGHAAPQVALTVGTIGDRVVLTVADNGPGIDPAIVDRIFEPFVTGKVDGLGLGLGIVRDIVTAFDGTVAVEPSPLGGAAFRVTVARAGGGDAMKVVLIDDDDALRAAIADTFAIAGIEAEAHADARTALRDIDADFAGIVVTDIRMPGMDGHAVFEAVRARDPELPVLLMTGHGDIAMAVAALNHGAFDFIAKPFATDHLVASVRCADVGVLFSYFLHEAAERFGRPAPTVTAAVEARLMTDPWRGNVRALRNFAVQTVLALPDPARGDDAASLADRVAQFEIAVIVEALQAAAGDVAIAAERLQMPRRSLYDRLQRHALDPGGFRRGG